MRSVALLALALLLAPFTSNEAMAAGPAEAAEEWAADEARIGALQAAQAAAWNRHDIAAYATLFTEDAHVINVLGWHWRSRAELTEKLGRGFAWVFADSTLTIEKVEVTFLAADLAVAHVNWTLAGARSPTGAIKDVPEQGVQTQVLRKVQGGWLIAHFQNTNSLPEREMPLGPVGPKAQ